MKTIKGQAGQSMYDLIIAATGSMEAGWQFCADNDLSITGVPEVGREYVVSDAALALGDAGVLQYMAKNGIEPGTLGTEPVDGVALETDSGNSLTTDSEEQIIV